MIFFKQLYLLAAIWACPQDFDSFKSLGVIVDGVIYGGFGIVYLEPMSKLSLDTS